MSACARCGRPISSHTSPCTSGSHAEEQLRSRAAVAAEAVELLQKLVDPRPEVKGHVSSVVVAVAGSPWHDRAVAVLASCKK